MAKLIDITGKAISGEWGTDDLVGNGVPVLRTTNFTNIGVVNFNNVVTRQIVKKSISEKLLRYGDIIIEKSGGSDKQPVGRVVFFEGEDNKYLFNNFTGLLRVRDFCKWNPKYIFYSLFANYAKGGTIPFENRTTGLHNLQTDSYVNSVMIVERKIEEQTDIVTILDKVNQLINYEKKQLEDLDILVKSRFIEMFGTFPDNPKGWECCTIRDIVKEVRYGSSRPAVEGGQYPYLRMNNITYEGTLDLSEIKYIDVPEKELEKCTVRKGDVLFNRTNSKELVGKTCLYDRDESMVLAGFIIRVRVNDKVVPEFLVAFLNMDFSKKMLFNKCKAAIGQANINAQELQNIEIYLPHLALQKEFVSLKYQVDKSKLAIQQSLDELETLKKSLMQQYFG